MEAAVQELVSTAQNATPAQVEEAVTAYANGKPYINLTV